MNTKDRILDVSLSMFSISGYEAVSIRDICGAVGIKESSLYYHFRNKQDILDSLMHKYENHISSLLHILQSASDPKEGEPSLDWLNIYFFDQYLFDPFCNRMMRLMLIEQFHNERIREAYERWLFVEPYQIQASVFAMLAKIGLVPEADATRMGHDFFATSTMLTFKYLLNGDLTQERKDAFRKEAHAYMELLFAQLGGNRNV
ncbi:MAG: TetR/AcrR family transcriptional regulator [Clostridia bacterium]|nr:TetR/AcrR family transcriptional regulator [Clostridia bacterium]